MGKNGRPYVMALDCKTVEGLDGIPVIRAQVAYSRYTYKLPIKGLNEFTVKISSEKIYSLEDIVGS